MGRRRLRRSRGPALALLLVLGGMAPARADEDAAAALERALARHRAGDLEGAVVAYRDSLRLRPTAEAGSNLGAALAALGRYQEAIGAYLGALDLAPSDERIRLNLALAHYKSADLAAAVDVLEELRRQGTADTRATLLLADCRLRLGQYEQVESLLRPLEAERAGDRAVLYMLGMALVRGGKPEEGQARIDALMRGGNSAEAQYLLGSAAFQGRDFPRAVEHLGQALTLRPDLPALRSYYGRALLFTGDAEGAEAALREAVVSDRNDYDASYHLASILATRGRPEEARPFAERAAELRPQSAEARALVERLDHPVAAAPDTSPLVGKPAPEVVLRRANGEPVPLSSFRGRPLVLVLGSLTCPQLRHGIPYVNRLYERYRGRAEFVMTYIREAHPEGGSWSSTINEREGVSLPEARTEAERVEHAALCRSRLDIPFEVMIDALDGAAEAAWGAFPSRAFVIDAAGAVTFSTTLDVETFRPEALEAAVAAVVR